MPAGVHPRSHYKSTDNPTAGLPDFLPTRAWQEEYGEYRMELVHQGLPTVVHWLRYKQYERLHKMLKKVSGVPWLCTGPTLQI